MDTDQNNSARGETKAALLGELESIKDLLSEEEMADIPLLDHPVETPALEDDAFADIPLLEEIESGQPLTTTLSAAHPVAQTSSEPDHTGEPLGAEPATNTSFEELSESIDATLANIDIDIDLTDEAPSSEDQASVAEDDVNPKDLHREYEADAAVDDFTQEDELHTGLMLGEEPTTSTKQEAVNITDDLEENLLDDESVSTAARPPKEEELQNGEQPITENAGAHSEPENTNSEASLTDALEINEEALPLGVLPGQRNLFDDSSVNKVSPEQTINPQKNASKPSKKSSATASKPRVKVEQAKGENPFLPKHIRERLHTTKSLMEVIKEAPLDTQAVYHNKFISEHPEAQALERTNHSRGEQLSEHDKLDILINEVIAEFMPKIEAELRVRLTNLSQQESTPIGSPDEQPSPANEPNNNDVN